MTSRFTAFLLVLLGGCHDWAALSRGRPADLPRAIDGPVADLRRHKEAPTAADVPRAERRDLAPAPDAPRRCSWTGSFSLEAPQPLAAVNSGVVDLDPFVTADGLTLYFSSYRNAGFDSDIFVASRATPGQPFGAVAPVAGVNTTGRETHLALSANGLTAYLAAEWSGGSGNSDLWYAVRSSASQPFLKADFKLVAQVNTPDDEYDPFPSGDGLRLYYSALNPPGGAGNMDVLFALRNSPGAPFSAPVAVPGVNTAADEDSPTLSADERVLVFGSSRPGTAGAKDLWYAVRPDRDAAFATPARVPVVNSAEKDMDPFVTADGCELYFASDRPGGAGSLDLYSARYVQLGP